MARYLALAEAAGIPTQMKHHLWVHMTDKTLLWWAEKHTATAT